MGKKKMLFLWLSFFAVGFLFFGSLPAFGNGAAAQGKSPLKEAREDLEQRLAQVPGFAGIAHSEEDGVIVVFLEHERARGNVPDSHRGFAVRKEVTGEFRALSTQVQEVTPSQVSFVRTGKYRPLVGGISVGALAGTRYVYAGTLGMVSYDSEKKILSNAHVLAMNPDNNAWLPLGTTILQPGTLDGGRTEGNKVGNLLGYIDIKFSKTRSPVTNYVDAAIASIDTSIEATSGTQLSETGNYSVSGTTPVSVGDEVRKSGRTTHVTAGKVSFINASTWINYGKGKTAYFQDQIMVSQSKSKPFIKGGDSGSIVEFGGRAVGLAFAGSDTQAIVNKASRIIDSGLGISFGP